MVRGPNQGVAGDMDREVAASVRRCAHRNRLFSGTRPMLGMCHYTYNNIIYLGELRFSVENAIWDGGLYSREQDGHD